MKQYFKWIFSAVVVMIIMCCPVLVQAQLPCDPATDPTCVPIDGGLGFLIAAGVGYGVKKVRDGRRQKRAEQGI